MPKLYIIGNGFDIAHNLNTGYWDFRKFLEEQDYQFLLQFEELYGIHYLDETEYGYSEEVQKQWERRVYHELWSEFERFMGFPNTYDMLNFSSSILDDLDLETGNIGIRDTMDEYWKKQYGFIDKLQYYVKEWILKIDISNVKPKKISLLDNDEDYFFNFNYTRVLEDIYKIDNVLHIHGSIGDDADMSPFMGHCNQEQIDEHLQEYRDAFEMQDEGEASIHRAIAEYLKAIFKDTSHYIMFNNYFFNRLKSVDEIIIIGWSAGDVDIPYLKKIRDSVNEVTKWTVYYYDTTAYNSLHKALSENGIKDTFQTQFIPSENFWD